MKRIVTILLLSVIASVGFSQKLAYVDTDYILNKIPAYKEAQIQLDNYTKQWQKEIEEKHIALESLYKQYQVDKVLLSNDMKQKREQEILNKEKELKELQKKRFGADGDRFKKEEELIKPIQDEVYGAIKDIAAAQNYGFIFNSSSSISMLHADPKYDISDEVLKKLGYLK